MLMRAVFGPNLLAALSLFAAAAGFPTALAAQDWFVRAAPSFGVTAGTTGLGLEAAARPLDYLGVRLGIGWIPLEGDIDEDDATGTVSPPSPITRLSVDLFPMRGIFHLTAGLVSFSDGVVATAMARDTITINDRDYSPEELGQARGQVWGRTTAPYLGLGWQNRSGRIQPHGELGVAFTGPPRIDVTVTGPIANEPVFMADLQQEIREAEEDIRRFRFYPVLAVGVRIRVGL